MSKFKLRAQILAALGVLPLAWGCDAPQSVDTQDSQLEGGDTGCGPELCNGLDDDCDGEVDEDFRFPAVEVFPDQDADGYPVDGEPRYACDYDDVVDGYAFDRGEWDCDDSDADVHPRATEVCNQVDDDCDGELDEGNAYTDEDGDGYHGSALSWGLCEDLDEGMSRELDDCDDGRAEVNPGADEVCGDGLDTDCDGRLSCLEVTYTSDEGALCVEPWDVGYMESYSAELCAGCDFEVWQVELSSAAHWAAQSCRDPLSATLEYQLAGDRISILEDGQGLLTNLQGTWTGDVFQAEYRYTDGDKEGIWRVDLAVSEIEWMYGEGRPFTVQGAPRVAGVGGGTWGDAAEVGPGALSPGARAHVANVWRAAGFSEHASVASFARFSLELMALGAPSELLLEASVAMADEVRHAELCFGLARAFGAEAQVGPLDVQGALVGAGDPAHTLQALLVEGCVGETLAAARADRALALVKDPAARRALQVIARDEARHAAYAWRCARWLLQQHPELAGLAARTLESERARTLAAKADAHPSRDELVSCGVLDGQARAQVTRDTWRVVLEPAWRALLGDALELRA